MKCQYPPCENQTKKVNGVPRLYCSKDHLIKTLKNQAVQPLNKRERDKND